MILKQALSSFCIAVLLTELRQFIVESRIDNVYQTNHNLLLLRLHKAGQAKLDLILEAGKRLNLTSYKLPVPQKPSSFCMALRKYLRNGKIVDVTQHKFDRIILLSVSTSRGEYNLEVELFGVGNIILTDQNNKILQGLHYRRMRDRNVLRDVEFAFPPSTGLDPRNVKRSDLDTLRNLKEVNVVRGLTSLFSLGGVYAEEILLRASVEKESPCETLSPEELDRIYSSIEELVKSLDAPQPQVVISIEGEWIDVVPSPLKIYSDLKAEYHQTLNEAVDEYYFRASAEETKGELGEGKKELSKLMRILEEQKEKEKELEAEISLKKKIGDLIYRHINPLTLLLEQIKEEMPKGVPLEEARKNLLERTLPDGDIVSTNSKLQTVTVNLEGETFELFIRKSVPASAEDYYKEAKLAKKKLEGLLEAIKETEERIRSLKKEHEETEESLELARRREKAWYEKYRWFRSTEGFLILGGRDATTNELLIKKNMEPHDIVLHADVQGAPFVIVKTEGGKPGETTIREAAQMAASYSRAWKEGLRAIDVYWVRPEQVDKSPPPGQYVKKGAFIIHGNKNYLRDIPLAVAVGVKIEDGDIRFIGGPAEAIGKQTKYIIRIVPGRLNSGYLAKIIRQALARMIPEESRKAVLATPLEEIQVFIPPGSGETT